MKRLLPEFFDAFLIVGVVAGSDEREGSVVIACETGTSFQNQMLLSGTVAVTLTNGLIRQ